MKEQNNTFDNFGHGSCRYLSVQKFRGERELFFLASRVAFSSIHCEIDPIKRDNTVL